MKYKPFTSKHCNPSRFTSPLQQTDAVEKKTQMDQINAIVKANQQRTGYTPPSNRTQPTISQGTEDSLFTKLKTIVSNPFDALKVALAPEEGAYSSLQALRKTKQAANVGVPEAKQQLSRTKAFNTLSQFVPAAATADAIASAVEGDPTAIVTKKLNKIKPAAKALKSINLDPTKTAKVLSTGIKVAKKI